MINLDDYRCGYVENHCIYNEVEDEKVTDFYNYYSQNGEDGVLEKLFEILDIKKCTFVNGGCDDIHDHSNVRRLVSTYGWDGLFIEPNEKMLSEGKENLENDERINNTNFNFSLNKLINLKMITLGFRYFKLLILINYMINI